MGVVMFMSYGLPAILLCQAVQLVNKNPDVSKERSATEVLEGTYQPL